MYFWATQNLKLLKKTSRNIYKFYHIWNQQVLSFQIMWHCIMSNHWRSHCLSTNRRMAKCPSYNKAERSSRLQRAGLSNRPDEVSAGCRGGANSPSKDHADTPLRHSKITRYLERAFSGGWSFLCPWTKTSLVAQPGNRRPCSRRDEFGFQILHLLSCSGERVH